MNQIQDYDKSILKTNLLMGSEEKFKCTNTIHKTLSEIINLEEITKIEKLKQILKNIEDFKRKSRFPNSQKNEYKEKTSLNLIENYYWSFHHQIILPDNEDLKFLLDFLENKLTKEEVLYNDSSDTSLERFRNDNGQVVFNKRNLTHRFFDLEYIIKIELKTIELKLRNEKNNDFHNEGCEFFKKSYKNDDDYNDPINKKVIMKDCSIFTPLSSKRLQKKICSDIYSLGKNSNFREDENPKTKYKMISHFNALIPNFAMQKELIEKFNNLNLKE